MPRSGRVPKGWVRLSLVALSVLLALTAVGTWVTHVAVRDQESRLLRERTSDVGLLLTTSIDAIPPTMTSLGGVLLATNGSLSAFTAAAGREVAAGPGRLTFALMRQGSDGWTTAAVAGSGLQVGQVVTGARALSLSAASRSHNVVATPVIGTGANRLLGFALDPPGLPAGTVIYRQSALGAVSTPRSAGAAPFQEMKVVLYASPKVVPGQVLVATTSKIPLGGNVRYESLPVGDSHWLLAAAATQPLVGSLTASAQWFALAVGLVGSVLIALVIETEARRRDAALTLYSAEHDLAETLQRSLLPELPQLNGLELGARYRAGGQHQQVGGDWFDVFKIGGDDRVGVVIGDVIGHDITAATAMSQIRAALRAYAWEGDEPAVVLERLDRLVDAFGFAQLVTVFYGVLQPPADNHSRRFLYANAGHLSPFVKSPDGQVRALSGGTSTVIGAPNVEERAQAEELLDAGSTLLLYTDGLVEVPGGSIADSLNDLATTLSRLQPTDPADALCEHVLAAMPQRPLHDDIALLAIRTLPTPPQGAFGPGHRAVEQPTPAS